MNWIFLAIVLAIIAGGWLLNWGFDASSGLGFLAVLLGVVALAGAALASVMFAANAWKWYGSEYKAQIINREYGTHYTREEVFYASDVIDTIRELDRKRIEVNGNLLTDKTK